MVSQRAAPRALAYFAPVSTDTQLLVRELLASQVWVERFLAEYRQRLSLSYRRAAGLLAEWAIPHVPASAGFSVWADLGGWLTVPTVAAEQALWRHIWETTRVNILPGGAFACPRPGWFRICHATDLVVVRDGITRLGRQLGLIEPPPCLDPVPAPRCAVRMPAWSSAPRGASGLPRCGSPT